MKYAIIAAGEGSRLAAEGVKPPKPLVKVEGEALIDRLIRIFMQNGADEIVTICNNLTPLVSSHLHRLQEDGLQGRPLNLSCLVKTTPSSMHSFYEISRYLEDDNFVLTTVDTIFHEDEFHSYVEAFRQTVAEGYDGMMGVTDFVDDEKPLWVGTDSERMITGFYDDNSHHCAYISGGIYGLTPKTLATLRRCIERGESRMRNFQRALVTEGLRLKAYPFQKVLDIDHAADIQKAERFLDE